ncbi:MAG TPA: hypothetical protein VG818_11775 [Gemmatimonadaceae bacterium]|nr:hypothetical protein [Gemmatimonadaceae bacterium]
MSALPIQATHFHEGQQARPLDAFRLDVAQVPAGDPLERHLGAWFVATVVLDAAAQANGAERQLLVRRFLREHAGQQLPPLPAPVDPEILSDAVLAIAGEMEDAVCLALADCALAALVRVLPAGTPVLMGRALSRRARLALAEMRTDAARRLWTQVQSLGRRHALPELTARAALGLGEIEARLGHPKDARRWFVRALAVDGSTGDTRAGAYHNLMVLSAAAGDFEASVEYGRRALATNVHAHRRTVLVHTAQLLLDMGHPADALRTFGAALALPLAPEDGVVACSGACVAAAHALDRDAANRIVDVLALRIQAMARRFSLVPRLQYALAFAFAELRDAYARLGRHEERDAARERGRAIAAAHGVGGAVLRLDAPASIATPPRPALSPAAVRRVLAIGAANDEAWLPASVS